MSLKTLVGDHLSFTMSVGRVWMQILASAFDFHSFDKQIFARTHTCIAVMQPVWILPVDFLSRTDPLVELRSVSRKKKNNQIELYVRANILVEKKKQIFRPRKYIWSSLFKYSNNRYIKKKKSSRFLIFRYGFGRGNKLVDFFFFNFFKFSLPKYFNGESLPQSQFKFLIVNLLTNYFS